MIKKIVSYSLVFLLSLLVFLIATMPANLLWQKVLSAHLPLQKHGIKVLAVSGSIWDGKAHIRYRHLEGIADWDVRFSELLTGQVILDLDLESGLGDISGMAAVSPSIIELSLPKAEIELSQISPFLKRERVTLDGIANINGLALTLENMRPISATGRGSWSGGQVTYPVGRKTNKREMPAFFAEIRTQGDGAIYLGVRDSDAGFDVIDATLNKEGEALLQVKRRLLDLAGEQARHKNETDVVFKVKKPLF